MPLTRTPLLSETVRKLVARGAYVNAFNILNRLHPADIAGILADLPEHLRREAFKTLHQRNLTLAGAALSELGPERGASILSEMSSQEISELLQELDPDDAAPFVSRLPLELQEAILGAMRTKEASEVEDLLQYPEETAGRIMSPKVFSLNEETTVGEAIHKLQDAGDLEMVFYIYVVDDRGKLSGVLSLRQLLLKRPETRLKDIMETDVIRVTADTDQEEVAQLVASYNLLAVPVVDQQNNLVGVITVDDVIDVIKHEATEDIFRLAGLDTDERVFNTPRTSVWKRFPWLVVNLATASVSTLILLLFRGTVERAAIAVAFVPAIANQAGVTGTQTSTIVVRALALGETYGSLPRLIAREWAVGAVSGTIVGSLLAIAAYLIEGNVTLSLILLLALAGASSVAAPVGTLVPLVLRLLRADPAHASNIFVTMITDGTSYLLALALAALVVTSIS